MSADVNIGQAFAVLTRISNKSNGNIKQNSENSHHNNHHNNLRRSHRFINSNKHCSLNRMHLCKGVTYVIWSTLLLVLTSLTTPCSSITLDDFFPFNTTSDNMTMRNDDSGSGPVKLQQSFKFFNVNYSSLWVANNGIITFDVDGSAWYQPVNFPEKRSNLVAPFWADVDINKTGGTVWYRQSVDPQDLNRASCDIRKYFQNYRCFHAEWIFVATWYQVGFYGADTAGSKLKNTFQAILVSGGGHTFLIFNYARIDWTTGQNSNGSVTTGLGGHAAQVGFNHKAKWWEIPGSSTTAVRNLTKTSNVGVPGRWVYCLSDVKQFRPVMGRLISDLFNVFPTQVSMLGGEEIFVWGPCGSEDTVIYAELVEWKIQFPCRYVNSTHYVCISPSVYQIGDVTLRFMEASNCDRTKGVECTRKRHICALGSWNFTRPLSVVNLLKFNAKVTRHNPRDWIMGETVRVSWDPVEFLSNVTLELLAFESDKPLWARMRTIKKGVIGTLGSYEFQLQANNSTLGTAIIKISSCDGASCFVDQMSKAIWSDVFALKWPDIDSSKRWCRDWIKREESLTPVQVYSCPMTLEQAQLDTTQFTVDSLCSRDFKSNSSPKPSCHYVDSAQICLRLSYPSANGSDQICCYMNNSELMDAYDLNGWGTAQRYHFLGSQNLYNVPVLSNFEHDVLPSLHCCLFNQGQVGADEELVKQFYKYRPRSDSGGYLPPAPAQGAGDPHLVTLDGKKYTFNGIGEFILVQDQLRDCVVQVRAELAENLNNNSIGTASVFTSIAIGGENKSTVEVRRHDLFNAEVLLNHKPIELHRDVTTVTSKGLLMQIERDNDQVTSVQVNFDGAGLSVTVEPTNDLINILIMVGNRLQGKLVGLLGNYDRNAANDFLPRGGQFLPENLSMREIHMEFGMSWNITKNESLFTYNSSEEGPHTYSNANFTPVFLDELNPRAIEAIVRQFCGESRECIFDYQMTGNEQIAQSTKAFVKKFEDIANAVKPVTRCEFPPTFLHAPIIQHPVNRKVGALTKYTCPEDHVEAVTKLRSVDLICMNTGQWSQSDIVCIKESTGKSVFQAPPSISSTTVSMTTTPQEVVTNPADPPSQDKPLPVYAIALVGCAAAGLVIASVVLTVFAAKRYRRQKLETAPKDIEDHNIELKEMDDFIMFRNPRFMEKLDQLMEDGSFKLPRPYLDDPSIFTEFF